jgi:hypothetical protein
MFYSRKIVYMTGTIVASTPIISEKVKFIIFVEANNTRVKRVLFRPKFKKALADDVYSICIYLYVYVYAV